MQNGYEMIRTTTGILEWVRQSLFRHATSCVENQFGPFGKFLSSSGGRNSETMIHNIYDRTIF